MPAFDQMDTISFTTTHAYEGGDIGGTLGHYAPLKAQYGKPTFVAFRAHVFCTHAHAPCQNDADLLFARE